MTLRERTARAIADQSLHATLRRATDLFTAGRMIGASTVGNWDELREAGRAIRARTIARLPQILDRLATNLEARGGTVHWASDAEDATAIVCGIARDRGARLAVKSKSMASEEIHLNRALLSEGVEAVETDLGEWIVQLAGETPSHILAPAVHRTRADVAQLFSRLAGEPVSDDPAMLCAFARERLRERFLRADLGISGVNFGIAETGTILLVTNEGNGRMVTSLPRTHVAIMGMERVVETWDELDVLLALLPRAATGQRISSYVTAVTGPRRPDETDGPDELHLVVLDNGRSDTLGTEFQEILHCIRCGACLGVCPVYRQVGGHAYGSVYSGPVGAVLSPLLDEQHAELPQASSLCGACWDACPVKIPLQDLLLGLRRRTPGGSAAAWKAWAAVWSRPAAYRASVRTANVLARIVPDAAARRWTSGREMPQPQGGSFRAWFDAT